jgi:hypothetical protein
MIAASRHSNARQPEERGVRYDFRFSIGAEPIGHSVTLSTRFIFSHGFRDPVYQGRLNPENECVICRTGPFTILLPLEDQKRKR